MPSSSQASSGKAVEKELNLLNEPCASDRITGHLFHLLVKKHLGEKPGLENNTNTAFGVVCLAVVRAGKRHYSPDAL